MSMCVSVSSRVLLLMRRRPCPRGGAAARGVHVCLASKDLEGAGTPAYLFLRELGQPRHHTLADDEHVARHDGLLKSHGGAGMQEMILTSSRSQARENTAAARGAHQVDDSQAELGPVEHLRPIQFVRAEAQLLLCATSPLCCRHSHHTPPLRHLARNGRLLSELRLKQEESGRDEPGDAMPETGAAGGTPPARWKHHRPTPLLFIVYRGNRKGQGGSRTGATAASSPWHQPD